MPDTPMSSVYMQTLPTASTTWYPSQSSSATYAITTTGLGTSGVYPAPGDYVAPQKQETEMEWLHRRVREVCQKSGL